MSVRPILYYALFSPPARAAVLTSKLIGLNVDLKPINFAKKEHHSDWFLKINPRHTIPVLVDEGVALCDSHAIVTYMVSKYGQQQHESLYPEDLLKRAVVNERLFYDASVLSQVIKAFAVKILYGDEISMDRKTIAQCHVAYGFLEEFLTRGEYVAGDSLSVADVSINPTLLTLHKMVPVEEKRYPQIRAWMQRMRQELPDYESVNEAGAEMLFQRFTSALEDNMTRHG